MQKASGFSFGSPILGALAVMGWLLAGAILVPTVYGLVVAVPDIKRYLRMRSM